jgi:RNA polymerase sigma-54 factor
MKPTLGLRTSQQLALTPQLQQSIRLLQLSTAELEQEIEQFLSDNPLLEITEPERSEPAHDDHDDHHDDQLPGSAENWSVGGKGVRDDDDDQDWMAQRAAATGLAEHLHEQAMALKLSPRDRAWLKVLIESLDDDGYLRDGLDEIEEGIGEAFEAAFGERLDEDEQTLGLTLLQAMDPAGVGARDLSECLRLQLSRQQHHDADQLSLAAMIAGEATLLEAVGARDFNRLCQTLKCDRDMLREVLGIITRLNPKPGNAFRQDAAEAVIPDVIAFRSKTRQGMRWQVRLNESAVPRLSINPVYAEMIRQEKASSMAGQLQEARWVIKNIQQRCDTILRVAQAIAKEQHAFFEQGETAMRPLVLREIAEQCELHESTVSRVTTNKYILTPMGTFELKYFFTSHVGTEDGGTASSTAIRAKIKQWIAAEDARKPLSDQQIADRFAQEGVQVARRTIAKYREALRIDPVSQRKKL